MASAILVTTSSKLLENVNKELAKQTAVLPKREIVEQSLKIMVQRFVVRAYLHVWKLPMPSPRNI